jgi:hypothetical protein
MTRTTNFMFVAALSVAVLVPSQLLAMDVQQFANMTAEDQKHYLSFLVRESQELLAQQGERDEARKVERLFRDVPRGSDRSIGESQFDALLPRVLHFVTNVPAPLKGTMRSSVESLLSQVLVNNGIKLTRNFTQRLSRDARNRVFYQKPN